MRILRDQTGSSPATYSNIRGVFAWQFVLKKRLAQLLMKKVEKRTGLISKELGEPDSANLAQDTPSIRSLSEDLGEGR